MKLSIVSPVYRAELVLDELIERISNNIPSEFNSYEIILVDDYSPDKSWDKIVKITKTNKNRLNNCSHLVLTSLIKK